MPVLAIGEFYLATDTNELYTGATPGNIPVGVPIFNAAGTRRGTPHIVADKVTIGGGGTSTVTLVGSAAFTSAASYICVGVDVSAKNRSPQITQVSGSQITFTANAGDTIQFICIGN
jgi:hypothetical protein